MKRIYLSIILFFSIFFHDAFAGGSGAVRSMARAIKWCAKNQGVCDKVLAQWHPKTLAGIGAVVIHSLDHWELQKNPDSWLNIGAMHALSTSLVSEESPYSFSTLGLRLQISPSQLVATGLRDIYSKTSEAIALMPSDLKVAYLRSLLQQTRVCSPDHLLEMMGGPYARYMSGGDACYNEVYWAGLPLARSGEIIVTGGFYNFQGTSFYHDPAVEKFKQSLQRFGLPFYNLKEGDFFDPLPNNAPYVKLFPDGNHVFLGGKNDVVLKE